MMTIRQSSNNTSKALLGISNEPATEARLILAYILKIPPSELINHYDQKLRNLETSKLRNLLNQRLTGKPLQYILKEAWFYNYLFYVDERVLIPRPETEFLVTQALEWIKVNYELKTKNQKLIIADIGTGCGNIAITLASEILKLETSKLRNFETTIYATDISSDAIEVAKFNAQELLTLPPLPSTSSSLSSSSPSLRVEDLRAEGLSPNFLPGSLLDPLPEPANLIITNLPYIPTDRIPHLQVEVKDYEPHLALDGGEDGLKLYRQLFQQMQAKWKSPGLFLAEIDYTHRHIAADIFKQYLPNAQVSVIIDPIHKQPFLQASI